MQLPKSAYASVEFCTKMHLRKSFFFLLIIVIVRILEIDWRTNNLLQIIYNLIIYARFLEIGLFFFTYI